MEKRPRVLLITAILILLVLSPLLLKILAQPVATVSVGSVSGILPGYITEIYISVSNIPDPGLASIQVGPKGAFKYDPRVMHVLEVAAVSPYIVLASNIDNDAGKVTFGVTTTAGPYRKEGGIVKLTVKAVGRGGDSTPLEITQIDALTDANDNPITDYIIKNGSFTIGGNRPPEASFTFSPAEPTTRDTVQFTDQSTDPDGEVVSWEWDFGDGTTSTERNPSHQYKTPGTFTVSLTVTDDEGAEDSFSREITVSQPPGEPPQAGFTFSPAEPTTRDTVQFTDQSSDPDGEIVGWLWDFGDGIGSESRNPIHKYSVIGTYTVTLVVTDNDGAKATISKEVRVRPFPYNKPPVARFSAPGQAREEEPIQFTDESKDPDGELVFWFWDFGDGSVSTERNPSHRYSANGTYTVTLIVADNDGATDKFSQEIKVGNRPPVASFTFSPSDPSTEDIVHFTDQSSDPDGKVVRWEWDFGDGNGSTRRNPTYRYQSPGTFTVRLTVTDNDGASSTTEKTITVGEPGPPPSPEPQVHAFPNPARDSATFKYSLPRNAKRAVLKVFNVLGRQVFHRELELTEDEFVWDLKSHRGRPLPDGPYFYYLTVTEEGGKIRRSKMGKLMIQRGG